MTLQKASRTMALHTWERASNYAGQEYADYYVVYTQHRDSDVLDRANFIEALERLGGESDTVIVSRATHWAVGWVEALLVHESDTDKVSEAGDIMDELARYPILDEGRYSDMEYEEWVEALLVHESDVDSYWQSCSLRERVRLMGDFKESLFAARSKNAVELFDRAPSAYEGLRE